MTASFFRHTYRHTFSLAQSTMKFFSPLALLALAPTASAWTTATSAVRSTRMIPATVLHSYSTATSGEAATESFRLSFSEGESNISPWHDIPLKGATDGTYNAVIEIPKMTKAKMEVATKEAGNPIAQDVKKGKLRDYHGPIFWNYGCLPQTWEDPNSEHPELKCFGDDDPIDVVEIGTKALAMGTVTEVKPLGVIAMIDDGELDWKVSTSKNESSDKKEIEMYKLTFLVCIFSSFFLFVGCCHCRGR